MGSSPKRSYDDYLEKTANITSNQEDDCDNLRTDANLSNLQPALAKYCLSDSLLIGFDKKRIVAFGEYGVCGYITTLDSQRLIDCMIDGKSFKAVIIRIDATSCRVRISIKL